MSVICKNCLYYENLAEQNLPQAGLCRRRAPQTQWQLRAAVTINWPLVADDDWCGEWLRRPGSDCPADTVFHKED